LWSWGGNSYGELGMNSSFTIDVPTRVGTAANWQSAVAGSFHTLGTRSDGSLYGWGYNENGSVGDNTLINRDEPVLLGCPTSVLALNDFSGGSVVIWPNPVSDVLHLQNAPDQIEKIVVTDMLGKVALEVRNNVTSLNVESLNSGVYILCIFSGNEIYKAKFVR